MRLRLIIAIAFVALLAYARAASLAPWPDDWDGIGFTLSIAHFDMDQFQPHAPGYPVYVAMLKLSAFLFYDPVGAGSAVALVSGVAAIVIAWLAARRAFDAERAWYMAFAMAAAPLVWRSSTSIGSEAPALMFAALVAYGLASDGRAAVLAAGIGAGLGLGVRLSWAPLYLAMLVVLPSRLRLRAIAVCAVATCAWLAPLVAIVGPAHFRAIVATHAAGHFTQWGGTSIVDPGPARLVYLARDLAVDGLGAGSDGLGLVLSLTLIALAWVGFDAWRENEFRHARAVVIALVPYLLWIALGQNIREQPRHALPLVAAIAGALVLGATHVTRTRTLGFLFVFLLGLRAAGDARDRLENPPPGAQLVERVRALPDAPRVAVFGGPSVRFFALTELASQAQSAGSLGDVSLAVGRMRALPTRVLVTGELEGVKSSAYPLAPFATLCRPPRVDRRAPCVTVFEWRAPFLPK